ncbi:MAG: hypothetical protein E7576_07875 [Ruminococcaceae bacterium]|nr:hypothetical protein [Oscillospiraceae bacterium]
MRIKDVRKLFCSLTEEYFSNAIVLLSRQSRIAKPELPLVLLTFGTVTRPSRPNLQVFDGVNVEQYASNVQLDIDLFTHGIPIVDQEIGVVGYEDSAVEDLTAFDDFLNSEYVLEWCDIHSLTIQREGDIESLSGIIGETSYEYRARMRLILSFVSLAVEHAAVNDESSIVYPTGRFDGDEEIFEPGAPVRKTSTTGGFGSPEEEKEKRATVVPHYTPTSSGGGSEILAMFNTGYFTEAEVEFVPYTREGEYVSHGFAVRGHLDATARRLLDYLQELGFYPVTADFDLKHSVTYVSDDDLIVEVDEENKALIIKRGKKTSDPV